MARSFVNNTQSITCSTFGAPPSQGTLSMWVRPNWNGGDSTTHEFFSFGIAGGSADRPSFQKFSDNNIYAGFNGQGLGEQRIVIPGSLLFSSGVWANWIFTYSSSGCVLYKNGVSVGTKGAITIPALGSGFKIGQLPASSNAANAGLAEFTLWSSVFSANEALALAKGVPPFFIRPSSLLIYIPIIGLGAGEPEWGSSHFPLTVGGSPPFATHAPISFWQPPSTVFQFSASTSIGDASLHHKKRGQAGTVMRGRLGTGGRH